MEDCITTLASLDDILATLRTELSTITPSAIPSSTPSNVPDVVAASAAKKSQDYTSLRDSLDLKRAKRLITARENSIRAVKASIQKAKDKQRSGDSEATHMGGSGA